MSELTNSDLTDVTLGSISSDGEYTVTGGGLFDDLMEAVNAHLTAQFKLGRLAGSDYANVYLGATQSAASQAVQYLLGKNNAALIDKQIELVTQQIAESIAKVQLIEAQTAESEAKVELTNAQAEKVGIESDLLTEKIETEATQQLVLAAQEDLYKEQAKGFYWNAMNKWAKLSTDVESVYISAEKDNLIGEPGTDAKTKNSLDAVKASKPVKEGGACNPACYT